MKRLILTSALGSLALLVSACGDNDAETAVVEDDAAAVDATASTSGGGTTTTASADWPRGTRIVEEGGVTYRVNPDGTRVEIANNEWRITTEGGTRYRVGPGGARIEIDEDGVDIDDNEPDGVDVDLGTNSQGNLDLDVSTDGNDASPDRDGDR